VDAVDFGRIGIKRPSRLFSQKIRVMLNGEQILNDFGAPG
jgi:hypothetical protein